MKYVRWFLVVFLVGLFGLLTQWIMFFPAYALEGIKFNPFWIWLDDSRIDAEDYIIWLAGKDENIFRAWKWHMRNKVWNLNNLFKVPKGKVIFKTKKNSLTRNDKKVKATETASLKYISQGVAGWNVNQGEFISKEFSTIGETWITYKIGNWKSFRYSFAKIVNFVIWKGWVTVKLGTNKYRYVFSLKFQKIKQWK